MAHGSRNKALYEPFSPMALPLNIQISAYSTTSCTPPLSSKQNTKGTYSKSTSSCSNCFITALRCLFAFGSPWLINRAFRKAHSFYYTTQRDSRWYGRSTWRFNGEATIRLCPTPVVLHICFFRKAYPAYILSSSYLAISSGRIGDLERPMGSVCS